MRRKRERPAWGPDASVYRVRVQYRTIEHPGARPSEHITTETMSHQGYFKWLKQVQDGKALMLSAEQVRDD